ncbi:hypothetical protein NP233_g9965 [Leucocoprinus birnbaumii]|uniref:Uncharacterized protein n=1 Tax=Leucocoprinus birnbaumii TaxID=56174 RepID=A0AAD5VJG3_9AGAR|nr:hypothetical protein NP233_g9965 [Leucocoprinus birnbaumii]
MEASLHQHSTASLFNTPQTTWMPDPPIPPADLAHLISELVGEPSAGAISFISKFFSSEGSLGKVRYETTHFIPDIIILDCVAKVEYRTEALLETLETYSTATSLDSLQPHSRPASPPPPSFQDGRPSHSGRSQ